jgi:hypothetical protein
MDRSKKLRSLSTPISPCWCTHSRIVNAESRPTSPEGSAKLRRWETFGLPPPPPWGGRGGVGLVFLAGAPGQTRTAFSICPGGVEGRAGEDIVNLASATRVTYRLLNKKIPF